ncbi:MAG: hypothetical protein AB8I08_36945, partial [Sandaracinaceae bacterium]
SVYLRSVATGVYSRLESFGFTGSSSPYDWFEASSTDRDGVIDLRVLPGVYDVVYRRYSSRSGDIINTHVEDDPYAQAEHVLQAGVSIGGPAQSLDVDLGTTHVTGDFLFNGATTMPAAVSGTSGSVYLRSVATGVYSRLESFGFTGSSSPYDWFEASSTNRDGVIDLRVLPGAYDVVYRRYSSRSGDIINTHVEGDPYAQAEHTLGMCVTVP